MYQRRTQSITISRALPFPAIPSGMSPRFSSYSQLFPGFPAIAPPPKTRPRVLVLQAETSTPHSESESVPSAPIAICSMSSPIATCSASLSIAPALHKPPPPILQMKEASPAAMAQALSSPIDLVPLVPKLPPPLWQVNNGSRSAKPPLPIAEVNDGSLSAMAKESPVLQRQRFQ